MCKWSGCLGDVWGGGKQFGHFLHSLALSLAPLRSPSCEIVNMEMAGKREGGWRWNLRMRRKKKEGGMDGFLIPFTDT